MTNDAIRCVVWDLDNTVWPGVALESVDRPEPVEEVVRAVATLEARGVVSSIASRNPPETMDALLDHPMFRSFVFPQLRVGWKSDSLLRIAAALGVPVAELAFVDDDPFERAEVSAMHPEVLVLDGANLSRWIDHPRLLVPAGTAEARSRASMYRQRMQRAAAATRSEDRVAFLHSCEIVLTAGAATVDDVDRLVELAARTTQFNSTGRRYDEQEMDALVASDGYDVCTFRLHDRFGDEGLVGAVVVHTSARTVWVVDLLAVSCRAAGHGVASAACTWLLRRAAEGGVRRLVVRLCPTSRNSPLRATLRALGLRMTQGPTKDGDLLWQVDVLARAWKGAPWIRLVPSNM